MATFYNTFKTHNNANGTTFDFPFPTLTVAGQPRTDIKVEVNGDLKTENTNGTNNDYSISGTNVVFNSTQTGVVHIYRDTNVASAEHVYATGSSIRSKDLNDNQDQLLFTTQEAKDAPISGSKIVNNSIPTDAYKDLSITAPKIADNAVITRTINNLAVTTGKIDNDAITSAKIADDAVGVDHIADNSITSNMIQNGAVNSVDIADNAVTNIKVADNAINTAELVNDAVTVGKIADNELKTLAGMQSATASQLASGTALTATTTNLNNLTGMSLAGSVTNESTKFPTSAAVKSYVDAQIASINAFEVLANEDSFPATQFADGVVLSISNAGGLVISSSGVATNARTVGSSSDNVTINGFPSSLYGEALPDSVGLLVTSTGANQTYTYHKLLATETDVKQLSDDINDFFARYRVGTVAPSTALDAGDLFYNTTSKVFQVYNGTAWEEVKNTGNFFISTLSPAFNGTVQDFTITNAPSYAEQIILSINGVIQKPNSGTSTPSEGFALSGSTIKLAAAPAAGSTYHAVVMGEAVNIGSPSDNTVTTTSLQNGAVSADKLQTDAVTTAKIADNAVHTNQLNNNAVNSDKIADNAINSEHYVDGSIDTVHIANDAVSADKIGTLTGNVRFGDNVGTLFGSSDKLQVYHSGSNAFLVNDTGFTSLKSSNGILYLSGNNTHIRSGDDGETQAVFNDNGAVELYYDNVKKFHTRSNGAEINGIGFVRADNGTDGILAIYADNGDDNDDNWRLLATESGSNFQIDNYAGGGWETNLKAIGNGAVELYHDNSKKFETTSTGATVTGQLSVAGVLKFDNDVNAGLDIRFEPSTNSLDFVDNVKARFGTGDDLEIYHDGTNSYIKDAGTGVLRLTSNQVQVTNAAATEVSANFIEDGAVELYYNNVKKFETTSDGVDITGTLKVNGSTISTGGLGNVIEDTSPQLGGSLDVNTKNINFGDSNGTSTNRAVFGAASDLEIYHNGSDSFVRDSGTGGLYLTGSVVGIKNSGANENGLLFTENGGVQLYYDNSNVLETINGGSRVNGVLHVTSHLDMGDSDIIKLGDDDDLQIYHDGSNSHILDNGTGDLRLTTNGAKIDFQKSGGEVLARFHTDGGVDLYYDNSKKFETTSNGVQVNGDFKIDNPVNAGDDIFFDASENWMRWDDNVKIQCGNSGDLEIYHDGSNSYITDNGPLIIRGDGLQLHRPNGNVYQKCIAGGAVELYHDNSKKFETESTGVKVTGNAEVTGNIELPTVNSYIKGNGSNSVLQVDATRTYFYGGSDGIQVRKADNSTHLITVDNSGNTTVSGGLTVTGDVSCNGGAGAVTIAGDSDIRFNNGNWTGESCKIQQHGNSLYLQGGSNSHTIILRSSDGHDRWRMQTNGDLFPGNDNGTDIGGSSNRVENIYVGGGVYLGGTGSANYLNDYEEGTWSPSLYGGSNQASGYSIQSGSYTKIGRMVHVNFAIAITGKGSMSGDLRVINLPFGVSSNVSGTSIEHSGICSYWSNVDPNSSHITIAADSDDSLYLRHTVGAEDNPDQMQASDIDSDFTVRGSISYYYG